jgi:RsiW-degrading membrane proteinase PrsW (M82 family)
MRNATGKPNARYYGAFAAGAVGLAAVVWTVVAGTEVPGAVMIVAAAAAPTAVLLAVRARLERPVPAAAVLGGAIIGPLVALLGHAVVAAFAAAFFLGFADSGRALLEELRVDPRIVDVLASPWTILLLVEYCVAAPLVEELGKALGARTADVRTREHAFLAGVAAGAGFAVVENVLYASFGAAFGGPWPAIVAARSLGAAVHPLASGLVMTGWWDARNGGGGRALARGYLSGAGAHAIWNGGVVAIFIVEQATAAPPSATAGTVTFTAMLGVAFAAWLWSVVRAIAADTDPLSTLRPSDARAIAAWIVLTAAAIVPVAFVVLAFPSFYGG